MAKNMIFFKRIWYMFFHSKTSAQGFTGRYANLCQPLKTTTPCACQRKLPFQRLIFFTINMFFLWKSRFTSFSYCFGTLRRSTWFLPSQLHTPLQTMLQDSISSILEVTWHRRYNVASRASGKLHEKERLGTYLTKKGRLGKLPDTRCYNLATGASWKLLEKMLQRSIKNVWEVLEKDVAT